MCLNHSRRVCQILNFFNRFDIVTKVGVLITACKLCDYDLSDNCACAKLCLLQLSVHVLRFAFNYVWSANCFLHNMTVYCQCYVEICVGSNVVCVQMYVVVKNTLLLHLL